VLEPAQPEVGVQRLVLGVAALTGPHQVDGAEVPLDLLGVQGAERGHPCCTASGSGVILPATSTESSLELLMMT
jgi:hypothetical protein